MPSTRTAWPWALPALALGCADAPLDPPPGGTVASVTSSTPGAPEGLDAIVALRIAPPSHEPLVVRYALGPDAEPHTADADEADFIAPPGEVLVPAGATEARVRIPILDDDDIEPARELLSFRLEPGDGYALGARASVAVRVHEGVCDRSPVVRDILMLVARVDGCADVTPSHLGIASLSLVGSDLSVLRPGDLSGFYNMRTLDLTATGVRQLSELADMPRLTTLRLRGNDLETLPPRAFEKLPTLTTLELGGNRLTAWEPGAFLGLNALRRLELRTNGLSSLPDGAFAGLDGLERLDLAASYFDALRPGVFAELSNLRWLYLGNGGIGRIEPGAFDGLDRLEELFLQDNGLDSIPATAFAGLDRLRTLRLDRNEFTTLPAGIFAGLGRLETLRLYRNQLASLPPEPFADLGSLRILRLQENRLEALPERAFAGVAALDTLDAGDNPGTPFVLDLVPERIDGARPEEGSPARVALRVEAGSPFRLAVPLAALGGSLSTDSAIIAPGTRQSAEVVVSGSGEAQLVAGPAPILPPGARGIELRIGDPLVLFGTGTNRAPVPERAVPPRRLRAEDPATRLPLAEWFRDPEGEPLTYAAATSDAAVATARVEDGVLILAPLGPGTTSATVTAADPGGRAAALSFDLVVRPPAAHAFDIDLILIDDRGWTDVFERAIEKWEAILADNELPDIALDPAMRTGCWGIESEQRPGAVDDILIVATVRDIDGRGRILGRAGPCRVRAGSALPVMGAMEFDAADFEWMAEQGDIHDVSEVILHEMAHILGVGTIWHSLGLLRNPSLRDPGADAHFAGPNAVAAFNARGGDDYDGGGKVPVENAAGPGSADSHWRESVLDHELMTPYQTLGEREPLSLITVESLADIGYSVHPRFAESYWVPSADRAADAAAPAGTRIAYGDDILRGPIEVLSPQGRVLRTIIPPRITPP